MMSDKTVEAYLKALCRNDSIPFSYEEFKRSIESKQHIENGKVCLFPDARIYASSLKGEKRKKAFELLNMPFRKLSD